MAGWMQRTQPLPLTAPTPTPLTPSSPNSAANRGGDSAWSWMSVAVAVSEVPTLSHQAYRHRTAASATASPPAANGGLEGRGGGLAV